MALPAFAAAATILSRLGIGSESKEGWLFSSWIACAGSIAIVAALGGVALFKWLLNRIRPRPALITTLAIFLGAAPLPYSTMLFSHAAVVGLIAISLWAIDAQTSLPKVIAGEGFGLIRWIRSTRFALLAGFAGGWAVASEYTAGLVVAGISLYVALRHFSLAPAFIVAAIGPLAMIPAYSWLCFHDALVLPYSLQAAFPPMKEGLYAIKWPDPATFVRLLLGPERGLLFWTPFLFLAPLGYKHLYRRCPAVFWLSYIVCLLQIMVISGRQFDWWAGPSLGPRYLAPMLPLLALPCAMAVQQRTSPSLLLAAYSIVITTIATLTDACPAHEGCPNPLFALHLPRFLDLKLSPNVGVLCGLSDTASVGLFYLVLALAVIHLWRSLPEVTFDNNACQCHNHRLGSLPRLPVEMASLCHGLVRTQ